MAKVKVVVRINPGQEEKFKETLEKLPIFEGDKKDSIIESKIGHALSEDGAYFRVNTPEEADDLKNGFIKSGFQVDGMKEEKAEEVKDFTDLAEPILSQKEIGVLQEKTTEEEKREESKPEMAEIILVGYDKTKNFLDIATACAEFINARELIKLFDRLDNEENTESTSIFVPKDKEEEAKKIFSEAGLAVLFSTPTEQADLQVIIAEVKEAIKDLATKGDMDTIVDLVGEISSKSATVDLKPIQDAIAGIKFPDAQKVDLTPLTDALEKINDALDNGLLTKDSLKNLVSKEDLENLVTKEDLESFAKEEDIKGIVVVAEIPNKYKTLIWLAAITGSISAIALTALLLELLIKFLIG